MSRSLRVTARRAAVLLGCLSLGLIGLRIPATTRQGINYTVHRQQLPLYMKMISFFDRHWQYRLLADRIGRDAVTDEARVRALLAWTRSHIRPTPQGFPVIDDHVLHIIIRGYGQPDQAADVFTTLATYAGIPAFWQVCEDPATGQRIVLSFARVGGAWVAADVAHGVLFEGADGRLLTMQELMADPALAGRGEGAVDFARVFAGVGRFAPPRTLRAEKQMPWRRLWFEVRRAAGWEDQANG